MKGFVESEPLAKARSYEKRMEAFIDRKDRPCFHLSPRVGWMNDPNGFAYYQGEYHLFYQYSPYTTTWAPMHWGHAVSKDLLFWRYLPCALAPDEPYDEHNGCFSGSAIELPDGRLLLMYTGAGAKGKREDGSPQECQTQCLAVGDGVDFIKYEGNPVIDASSLPEGSSTEHFRDPKIWQEEDGTYRAVLASLAPDKSGQIVLYRSDDAFTWQFEHVVARNSWRYGIMWECPDLFHLDGKDVLLLSPQDMLPQGHEFYSGNGTLCIVGHVDPESGELVEETISSIDHGTDFYATQTLLTPDCRRVMVAWMQNWDALAGSLRDNRWFGQMATPRELSVRDGRLYQWPIRELEGLRRNQVVHQGIAVDKSPIALDGVRGRVVDMLVSIRPEDADDPYREFVIWFAQDERFHSSVRYRPEHGSLEISRIHAGSRRAYVQHRKCTVPGTPTELTLRLVLDRFSVEVFANDGVRAMSMTISTEVSADAITFSCKGRAVFDVEKYDLVDPTEV
ncbi:MAG: glycoside hydrolase family 32 protein [Atopobiaceae bacterium]|nr:glycoside hydrolase family 32 protein [Atopobiaceae bacterium]